MLVGIIVLYYAGGKTFDILETVQWELSASSSGVVVPGIFCRLCSEDAHVPGPYLAAGCPYRGTHCRECHPGRCFAKDGRLRFFKVFFPHVSIRGEVVFYSVAGPIRNGQLSMAHM